MRMMPPSARRWHGTIPLVVAALSASMPATPARAQDAPSRVGIAFGYAGPGLLWRVNDDLSLWPALHVSGSKTFTGTLWSAGPALGVVRTVAKVETAAVYVAPRLSYTHSWGAFSADEYSLSTGVGVLQHLPGRLALYAEAGPSFTERDLQVSFTPTSTTTQVSRSWVLVSGVGVVWYIR